MFLEGVAALKWAGDCDHICRYGGKNGLYFVSSWLDVEWLQGCSISGFGGLFWGSICRSLFAVVVVRVAGYKFISSRYMLLFCVYYQ